MTGYFPIVVDVFIILHISQMVAWIFKKNDLNSNNDN
jgi:hypothetical protein